MGNFEQRNMIVLEDIEMKSLLDPEGRDNLGIAPKNPELVIESSEVMLKKESSDDEAYRLRELEYDARIYEENIKFPEEVTHVNIEYIVHASKTNNPYPFLEGEELLEMENSLKQYGQIFPFLVIKQSETMYTLLDGNTRMGLMRYMYVNSNKEMFKTVKCFVFDTDALNEIEMMDIILSCNISRKCSNETMTRVYMTRIEVEKKRKMRKNEINIYKKVARDMGVSVSTVHNYRTLSNCSEKTMYLLDSGYIHSGSARKLATYSKEMQDKIIDEFGLHNVRDAYIKWIRVGLNERSIKPVVKMIKAWKYPPTASLKITGMRNDIIKLKEDLEEMLKTRKVSSKLHLRILRDKFNFTCGYEINETLCKKQPDCYKEVLNEENHPQMDIIKKSRRRE